MCQTVKVAYFLAIMVVLTLSATLSDAAEPPVRLPYLLHLPGVGGTRLCDQTFLAGMKAGGLEAEYRLYDWTQPDPGLPALQNLRRNLRLSQRLADDLAARIRRSPDRPVYLTAHSGGTAIAVWTLERLPPSVHVDSVLLIATALSPTYDLSKALAHVRHRVYAINSEHDIFVLGAGTRSLGTMDRVKTDAAGKLGFIRPPSGDRAAYEKLVQIPYDPGWWRQYGNAGDHVGAMNKAFASAVLHPLLTAGRLPVATSQAATRPSNLPAKTDTP